jgi:phosphatidate cytidylyltransferase
LITISVLIVSIFQIIRINNKTIAVINSAVLFWGVLYVSWLLNHLIMIRKFPQGQSLILALLLITWLGDTLAYLVGGIIGRHKLCPSISPNKSIEGAVAAIIGSLIGAYISIRWLNISIPKAHIFFIGISLGVLGIMGDLTESFFKRSAGVKDSGIIMPGHGGILDRIDSLLFTAPAFYYYLTLILH